MDSLIPFLLHPTFLPFFPLLDVILSLLLSLVLRFFLEDQIRELLGSLYYQEKFLLEIVILRASLEVS